jgi:NAD(P)H-flavin reductase
MSLLCLAKILRHEAAAPGHYRLTFAAPEMARVAEPGQFVHVRCGDTLDPLLRRPLSLHGIDRAAGTLTLLYRVVGRGTELLSRLPAGATLDVMGPLGRGFYLPAPLQMTAGEQKTGNIQPAEHGRPAESNRVPGGTEPATSSRELSGAKLYSGNRPVVTEALVVGGGLGVAPLLPLVEALVQRGLPVTVMLGARSADGLLAAEDFGQTGGMRWIY